MGISGLLPLLAPITREAHLKDLDGLRVAVDAYVWLHRGAFGCAIDLAQGGCTSNTSYISFCMKRINLLKEHNIQPILVFDGGCLPMKSGTEIERRKRRKDVRIRAAQELASGNKGKAMDLFQQSTDVTPLMAYQLIKTLRENKIEYIVAPYEADAQLAYLDKINHVDAVLTEDSDLIVFGCKRVLLKLDANGNVMEIKSSDLRDLPCLKRGWTFAKFRQACILSGCDYVSSLKGIGLKKAIETIGKYGNMEKAVHHWQTWGKLAKAPTIRKGYLNEIIMAEHTFLYQRVYDPNLKKMVHLNEPLNDNTSDMSYVGPYLEPSIAQGIAEGLLNPFTKREYGDCQVEDEFGYAIVKEDDWERSAGNNEDISATPVGYSATLHHTDVALTLAAPITTTDSSTLFSLFQTPSISSDHRIQQSQKQQQQSSPRRPILSNPKPYRAIISTAARSSFFSKTTTSPDPLSPTVNIPLKRTRCESDDGRVVGTELTPMPVPVQTQSLTAPSLPVYALSSWAASPHRIRATRETEELKTSFWSPERMQATTDGVLAASNHGSVENKSEAGKENLRPLPLRHSTAGSDKVREDDFGGGWEPKRKVLNFKSMKEAWEFKEDRIAPMFGKRGSGRKTMLGSASASYVEGVAVVDLHGGGNEGETKEQSDEIWPRFTEPRVAAVMTTRSEVAAKALGKKLQERFGMDPDLFGSLAMAVADAKNKKAKAPALFSKKRRT